ncbi:type IV pilus biogenesis protein EbsA [Phormidesmis sp. 146-12]
MSYPQGVAHSSGIIAASFLQFSMTIEQLQPASIQQVGLYLPYYPVNKKKVLPDALSLHQTGAIEGKRNIEGASDIPFIATWNVSPLPADLCLCRIQFDGKAELSYEITMENFKFVDFLIEVLMQYRQSNGQITDFSRSFYRKLLRFED